MLRGPAPVSNPNVIRILYVKPNIDEKESSDKLEEAIHRNILRPVVVFTCVTSGLMALECLNTAPFDLLILGERLPDINGSELLVILEKNRKSLPAVFLVQREELTRAQLEHGGNVLADPFSDFELSQVIQNVLVSRGTGFLFCQSRRSSSPSSSTTSTLPMVENALPDAKRVRSNLIRGYDDSTGISSIPSVHVEERNHNNRNDEELGKILR